MSQNDPKTTSLMTSLTKNPHSGEKIFSSAIYQTGRSVWAIEQLSSAIGGGARALVRQPKTFFFCENRQNHPDTKELILQGQMIKALRSVDHASNIDGKHDITTDIKKKFKEKQQN